ncbi:MAG: beta-galactosidase [Ignavibacteriaceae bacterium]
MLGRLIIYIGLILIFCGRSLLAQEEHLYKLDVASKGLKPQHEYVKGWGGKNPKGDVIRANSYYFEYNEHPMSIVAGEFQPQRYPESEWEDAIIKMKAAGLNTISSYIYWTFIEPEPGKFNFTGRNNIKRFAELCKKHNMRIFLRPGPFNNSEILIGGLPAWFYGKPCTERSNQKAYLNYVKRYYTKLAEQLKGYFWEQGGNIIAVQPENELGLAPDSWNTLFQGGVDDGYNGPTGSGYTEEYYNLYNIAHYAGMLSPIYTVTSWGATGPLPTKKFMPTYGGYMYLGPPGDKNSSLTLFSDQGSQFLGKVPVGFCEIGTGSPDRDDFRPNPSKESYLSTAMGLFGGTPTTFVGYYMFHGGSNPMHSVYGFVPKFYGLPLISYDFNAPIGEYGNIRSSYYFLRPFNLFLQNFVDEYADGEEVKQLNPVNNPEDDSLRVIAKSNNDSGFIFAMNYGNIHPLSDKNNIHFEITTSKGIIDFPKYTNLNMKSGAFAIIPFNLKLSNGVKLIYATAWPFIKIKRNGEQWIFFHNISGCNAEFKLAKENLADVVIRGGQEVGDDTWSLKASRNSEIIITGKNKKKTHLVLLSEDDGEHITEINSKNKNFLVLSDQPVLEDGKDYKICSLGKNKFTFDVFPASERIESDGHIFNGSNDGLFDKFNYESTPIKLNYSVDSVNEEKTVVRMNTAEFNGLNNIYMSVNYEGNICRLFDINKGLLIGDNYFKGKPWELSLKRFEKQLKGDGLMLRIAPRLKGAKETTTQNGILLNLDQIITSDKLHIKKVNLIPEYKFNFKIF